MKRVRNDLTGKKFGRLTVIGIADDGKRKTSYICECECGNVKKARADGLISGAIRSCGCLKHETNLKNVANVPSHKIAENRGYKVAGTRLYMIWQGMKRRCYKETEPCYSRYGGRGIKICSEWLEDYGNFHDWAVENGYNDSLTIDRIDTNSDYTPDNCRWATNEQQSNNRRSNIIIKIGNAKKSLMEWCKIFELDYKKVYGRYNRNKFVGIDELFRG